MFPGSGPGTKKAEEEPQKVLRYEKGLLDTVLAEADSGESDLMDNHHTLFLMDLLDLQAYTNVILLEQVADLVRQKTIGQLPKAVWEMLQLFQFGDREEALRMLLGILGVSEWMEGQIPGQASTGRGPKRNAGQTQ